MSEKDIGQRSEVEEQKCLPLVVPTMDEFCDWCERRGFTKLEDYLVGYAAIHDANRRIREDAVEDPDNAVAGAIYSAEREILVNIFDLFVCAFKDFAETKGGAK